MNCRLWRRTQAYRLRPEKGGGRKLTAFVRKKEADESLQLSSFE